MEQLPQFAAWRFVDAVEGFEVVYTAPGELRGHTSAVEDGRPYAVRTASTSTNSGARARSTSAPTPLPAHAK
jgi:hypothetical protein